MQVEVSQADFSVIQHTKQILNIDEQKATSLYIQLGRLMLIHGPKDITDSDRYAEATDTIIETLGTIKQEIKTESLDSLITKLTQIK